MADYKLKYTAKEIEERLDGGVSSWNDLTDKPFYKENGTGVILPKTYIMLDEGMASLPHLYLKAGNTYTVYWNGTEYTCVAQEFSIEGVTGVLIGDASMFTGGESTGEPFVIPESFGEENMCNLGALDGSATATLGINGETTIVHKLPTEYLDTVWNAELTDKVVLLDEETVTVTDSATPASVRAPLSYAIADYDYAIVTYNGDKYVCEIYKTGTHTWYIGNKEFIAGVSGQYNTGEPFLYYSESETTMRKLYSTIVGDITFTVELAKVKKIPDALFKTVDHFFMRDSSNGDIYVITLYGGEFVKTLYE